uniref:Uncharacterized protein n=1 Tax=Arundo donax TaxID=35708 RepID=A0A0A9C7H1_ARUDO
MLVPMCTFSTVAINPFRNKTCDPNQYTSSASRNLIIIFSTVFSFVFLCV